MKIKKEIFSIIFVVLLIAAWILFFTRIINTNSKYRNTIESAENSMEKKLYLQAVEYYEQAYQIKSNNEIYEKIYIAYENYYDEISEATTTDNAPYQSEELFITFLENAITLYPNESKYWIKLIQLELKKDNYKSAISYANKAKNHGITGTEFDELYDRVYYMIEEDFGVYANYMYNMRNYYTVSNDNNTYIIDLNINKLFEGLLYLGPVNADGYFLAQNSMEAYISDMNGVSRGRFGYIIEEAGYYSKESNLIAVKSDGEWFYVNIDGEKQFGSYDVAGTFVNHQAAVKKEDEWFFINEKGEKISDKVYEDIKLDLTGSYINDNIILIKEDGKYYLADKDLEAISKFSCDDIDLYAGNDYIAYKENDKWGFVDKNGKIVKEAEYNQAKSFSTEFAAVCDENGKWGFINKQFKLVIDYTYLEGGYFDSAYKCMIKDEYEQYKFIKFKNT